MLKEVRNNRSVLIVEDQMIIALMLEKMVMSMGHTVVGKVTSGEAAVEAVKEHDPDLILMDIRLQGKMDGVEAMKKINEQIRKPVIFVTGNSDEAQRQRVKEIDHLDFLVKPVSYNDLTKSMNKAKAS
ncbi:MAG: response regulator [Balneolaceae bacterium]|nr:response regulator [Balneolaceae bacterium]